MKDSLIPPQPQFEVISAKREASCNSPCNIPHKQMWEAAPTDIKSSFVELRHTAPVAEKPQLDNLESQIMEIKSRSDTKPRRVTLASVGAL